MKALNILLTGRHAFTPTQAEVLAFLISLTSADPDTPYHDLPIRELSKLTARPYTLPELRTAIEAVGSRMYTEESPELRQFWLFQQCVFIRGTGILRVWIAPPALSHLLDLKKTYSFAALAALLQLTSRYARLLYQLSLEWKAGATAMSLPELQSVFGLTSEQGTLKLGQISHLRDKVLAPAIRQIWAATGVLISYQFERQGRAYHTITFAIQQPQ